MNKILTIAKVNLLEVFRDMKSNAITFVLPAIFMLIFGFLFSQTQQISQWKIGVVEGDDGIIKALETVNEGMDEDMFEIIELDEKEEGLEELRGRGVELFVFSDDLVNGDVGGISMYFDESNQRSGVAVNIVRDIFANVEDDHIVYESVVGRDDISGFELMAPGLIIYGILIIIPHVAGSIARINEKGYLLRYSISKTTSFEIISGFTISNLLIGIIQTILLLFMATWFGLQINMYTFQSLVFVFSTLFFSVGLGLLLGTFFEKGDAGQNLGIMFSVVLGFLSGSFIIGIENIGIDVGDRFLAITDLVPTFYAYSGMRDLIVFSVDFSEVVRNLIVITVSSVIVFILGVYFYNRRNLKNS